MESGQKDMDAILLQLLYGLLQSMGLLSNQTTDIRQLQTAAGVGETHGRWLAESYRALDGGGLVQYDGQNCRALAGQTDLDSLWHRWEHDKHMWLQQDALRSYVALIDATIKALPEILDGRRLATDVVFPDASMRLVEGVYRGNPVSDHFNEVLSDCVESYVRTRLQADAQARIRILEIGAGTGGTSVSVFRRLKPFQENIAEYCYTDLSKAFLFHAEQEYGPENPYLNYRIFDVAEPVAAQGMAVAAYDLILGTNVLHATADIRRSVRNAKAALRPDGLLLLKN